LREDLGKQPLWIPVRGLRRRPFGPRKRRSLPRAAAADLSPEEEIWQGIFWGGSFWEREHLTPLKNFWLVRDREKARGKGGAFSALPGREWPERSGFHKKRFLPSQLVLTRWISVSTLKRFLPARLLFQEVSIGFFLFIKKETPPEAVAPSAADYNNPLPREYRSPPSAEICVLIRKREAFRYPRENSS